MTLVKPEQDSNEEFPMLVMPLPKVTLVRLVRLKRPPGYTWWPWYYFRPHDHGDAVGDRDAAQAGAIIERSRSDAGDTVWNFDTGQTGARFNA